MEQRSGPNRCTLTLLGLLYPDYDPTGHFGSRTLDRLQRALAVSPGLPSLWLRHAGALQRARRWKEARAALDSALRRSDHAVDRLASYAGIAGLLRASGREAEAERLTRALAVAMERDGRPGVMVASGLRFRYLPAAATIPGLEIVEERRRLAAIHGDLATELAAMTVVAANLSDAGRPLEALPLLDSALLRTESLGWPELRAQALRLLGRANTKLGRLAKAEQDLRASVEAAIASGDDVEIAEAWHQLAHVYEAQNRLDAAVQAADRFVSASRGMQGFQLSMMSWRDAGLIRWKAGQAAASNAAFANMVEAVDYQRRYHYWAGEHFERIGELHRAAEYYSRGLQYDPAERSLNLGGLARVLDALGLEDSAIAVAGAHDAAMSNQLDYPLLPALLARAGRVTEGLEAARAWARIQATRGHLQGTARARTVLAELLLDAGQLAAAEQEAQAARDLAERVGLAEEWARAERVRGVALAQNGHPDSGIRALRTAAARARLLPGGEAFLGIHLSLADALASQGGFPEALAAYDRAARAVEASMADFARDIDRARYRQRQLAPFDRAIQLLLDHPGPDLGSLAEWSGRRKAAALASATGVPIPRRNGSAPALARLQQGLGPAAVLLDYQIVDQRVAALVISARTATTVLLEVKRDSLTALVERLRAPLLQVHGGSLDLARARFDQPAAAALYQALIAPLRPLLDGARRLLIVPDGPLHYLAFDALVTDSGPDGPTYLLDPFEIAILPSLRFVAAQIGSWPTRVPRRILALGHDAPGVAEEIAVVSASWKAGEVHSLLGDHATEAALKRGGSEADLLHLAAHAIADDRRPEASHLRLAPDSANDGFLHLNEIAGLVPRGATVILSACETLAGRSFQGEGLLGLARGFLAAGAGSVVATQWPVGGAVADLMGRFHRELAAGKSAGSALRAAKLAIRQQPRSAHPFYWAGFVLVEGAGTR
jgi:CHAT domain-containing protein/tetratricopeptide (TPR) repeat protein